ncbi:hypothetical protein IFM89_009621 [Coptis chinensis]|uniref:RNase H type-1 domain-containing protein n=1 Tax=Coptis chinensis TaxID=261450 RepID=A0A835M998_9MAGN|nr:hypothetical protein IFM89_009621 [Coptis chinensis]
MYDNRVSSYPQVRFLVRRAIIRAHHKSSGHMENSVHDLQILRHFKLHHKLRRAPKIFECFWLLPPPGILKINTDGCSRGNPGRSGWGFVFRNYKGEFLGAAAGGMGTISRTTVHLCVVPKEIVAEGVVASTSGRGESSSSSELPPRTVDRRAASSFPELRAAYGINVPDLEIYEPWLSENVRSEEYNPLNGGVFDLLNASGEYHIGVSDIIEHYVVRRSGNLNFSLQTMTTRSAVIDGVSNEAWTKRPLLLVGNYCASGWWACDPGKKKAQKDRARDQTRRGVMETRVSDLVTREDRNRARGGSRRPSGSGASGAGGSSSRPERGSIDAPLELETVVFNPHVRSRSEKRRNDTSEQDAARVAKVTQHALGESSSAGGASGGGQTGTTATRRNRVRSEQVMDLATFGVGSSPSPVVREPSPLVKAKAPRKVSGKAVMVADDLESQFVYLDDNGVQRTVRRTDCSFRSSKKLKEIAQFAEADREAMVKLSDELKNVQDTAKMEREELEDLKKAHQALSLAKMLKDTEAEDMRQKLQGVEENVLAATVEIDYNALKEELACCTSRTAVEQVQGDVGSVPASSVIIPEAVVPLEMKAIASPMLMSLDLDGVSVVVDGRDAEIDESLVAGELVVVPGDGELSPFLCLCATTLNDLEDERFKERNDGGQNTKGICLASCLSSCAFFNCALPSSFASRGFDHSKVSPICERRRKHERNVTSDNGGDRVRSSCSWRSWSPQRVGDTDRHAGERSDLRQGRQVAGENSSPRCGDVESEFYYLGKTGKKRMVKRSDCSFQSAPIATSVLKGIVLDGDKAEVKDEGMETLLGTMDMAACLFLAGYDKLKDAVQNVETDDNPHVELGCMRATWGADKRKLEVMTNKYQNVAAKNVALVTDMTDLEKELAEVTAYAKKCQKVASKAQEAYTKACVAYVALDEKYDALKKATACEEQGQGVRVMLRSARNTASTSAAPEDKHVERVGLSERTAHGERSHMVNLRSIGSSSSEVRRGCRTSQRALRSAFSRSRLVDPRSIGPRLNKTWRGCGAYKLRESHLHGERSRLVDPRSIGPRLNKTWRGCGACKRQRAICSWREFSFGRS